ncbi:DUF4105 domain-containing protein [Flavobacteriaceae bacterium F08102]|nr:DUF4105 domain-containing protein [Flavobacteriaceae bacterium F08102]
MKHILFLVAFMVSSSYSLAQQLTKEAEISVITVAPGSLLLDAFGHSAFRVYDKANGIDRAYNYGTYDFNTPNFYGKFAQGKLRYDLAAYPFPIFAKSYVAEKRSIREQILNLSLTEKQAFFDFLENNAKPANKSYLYDFFFDNCATRIRTVGQNILKDKVQFSYKFANGQEKTFRNLIHDYSSKHTWGTFGIDLALGSVIDRQATPVEYTFLPDYIHATFAESTLHEKPIVKKDHYLYKSEPAPIKSTIFSPLLVFSLLAILVIFLTLRDIKRGKRSRFLDFCLFFIPGIIGLLILLLWFATDHSATANNFNILWAFAPNLVIAFVLVKKQLPPWIIPYVWGLVALIDVTIVLWIIQVQLFPIALIPIVLMLGVRYMYLIYGNHG